MCGDDEYAVHKCIVCPRSDFFAKACDSGFEVRCIYWHGGTRPKRFTPVNETQESFTNRIVLYEKPDIVKGMIDYLYTLDYQVKPHPPETGISRQSDGERSQYSPKKPNGTDEDAATACNILSAHILMYSLADRMFIHGLKALSKDKVKKELARRLDSITFPHAIFEIYSTTPASDRGLRDLVVKMTMDNLVSLRSGAKTMDPAEEKTGEESEPVPLPDSLVKSVPQFSSDLAVAMMDRTVTDWNCHGMCKPNWVQQDTHHGTQSEVSPEANK